MRKKMIENGSKMNSCQTRSLLHNLKQQNHTGCSALYFPLTVMTTRWR